eukprot:c26657_g1_i1 orf=84-248(+)
MDFNAIDLPYLSSNNTIVLSYKILVSASHSTIKEAKVKGKVVKYAKGIKVLILR